MGLHPNKIARSRVPWRLRILMDPAVFRYWVLVAGLALTLGWFVSRSVQQGATAKNSWGQTQQVLVAISDLKPGVEINKKHFIEKSWPKALIAPSALSSVPAKATLIGPLGKGMALTSTALRQRSNPEDLRQTISVPVDERSLGVKVGDVVDLWSIGAPGAAGGTSAGTDTTAGVNADEGAVRVADGATVITTTDSRVTLAIRPSQVARSTQAVAQNVVVLVGSL